MKKVALAFSGGGAKVIHYTELIRVMEKCDIKTEAISAISSGTFIAILIAAGYNGDEAAELLKTYYAEFNKLILNPKWSNSYGLFSNNHIRDVINLVCAQKGIFEMVDFDIPIQIVAYDVYHDRKVYFTNEPIKGEFCITKATPGDAVAASSALPIIYNGKTVIDNWGRKVLCSDGGIRGDYSVSTLRKYNVPIIACGYKNYYPKIKGIMSIAHTMTMGSRWILSEQERKKADYSLEIDNPTAMIIDVGGRHFEEYAKIGKKQIEDFFSNI